MEQTFYASILDNKMKTDKTHKQFGYAARLLKYRQEMGFTQQELCKEIGVHKSTYNLAETGQHPLHLKHFLPFIELYNKLIGDKKNKPLRFEELVLGDYSARDSVKITAKAQRESGTAQELMKSRDREIKNLKDHNATLKSAFKTNSETIHNYSERIKNLEEELGSLKNVTKD